MRWLFFIILAINVAYIAWQTKFPESTDELIKSVVSKDNSITLLSERDAKPGVRKINARGEDEVIAQTDLSNASVEEDGVINQEQSDNSLASERQSQQQGAPENNQQNMGQITQTSKALLQKDQTSETVSVKGNKSEQVLSEKLKHDQQVRVPGSDKDIISTEPEQATCYTVGPFQSMEKLRGFVKDIKSYVAQAGFRNMEEKMLTVYWVYLKPVKSRKQARSLGKELKAKKIKDFYIIRTGEKNNGISLGHFKSKQRATKLYSKVKKLGFDVIIEPVFKAFTVYWLDYKVVGNKDIPESVFDRYTQSSEKLGRVVRDCANNE